MDEKFNISIKIAERIYQVSINRGEEKREEMIRNAAGMINDSIMNFRQRRYINKDDQDYLAMTAIQLAVKILENESDNELTPLIKEMKKINYELKEAIDQE